MLGSSNKHRVIRRALLLAPAATLLLAEAVFACGASVYWALLAVPSAAISVCTGIVAALAYADRTTALDAIGAGISYFPLAQLEQHVFATRFAEQLPAFANASVAALKVAEERYAAPATSPRHCATDRSCNVKADLSPSMQRLAHKITVIEGEEVHFQVQEGTRRIVIYSPISPQDHLLGPFKPVGNGIFVHLTPG